MFFVDGASPPQDIIQRWLDLVASTFARANATPKPCIAVHCIAGLGRYVCNYSYNLVYSKPS